MECVYEHSIHLSGLVGQGSGLGDLAFVEHVPELLGVLTADIDLEKTLKPSRPFCYPPLPWNQLGLGGVCVIREDPLPVRHPSSLLHTPSNLLSSATTQ